MSRIYKALQWTIAIVLIAFLLFVLLSTPADAKKLKPARENIPIVASSQILLNPHLVYPWEQVTKRFWSRVSGRKNDRVLFVAPPAERKCTLKLEIRAGYWPTYSRGVAQIIWYLTIDDDFPGPLPKGRVRSFSGWEEIVSSDRRRLYSQMLDRASGAGTRARRLVIRYCGGEDDE